MCKCFDCGAIYGEFHRARESWLDTTIDPEWDYWTWICSKCLDKRNAKITGIDFIRIVPDPSLPPPIPSSKPLIEIEKKAPKYLTNKKKRELARQTQC